MRRRVKVLIKLWVNRALMALILILILGINFLKLQNNSFSNHEKAVDFGRIQKEDKLSEPVIAAVFYKGQNNRKSDVSSYFDHSGNYKKQNVKLIVVPRWLSEYSYAVVEKLYAEIRENNFFARVLLVHNGKSDVFAHKKMLQHVMKIKDISVLKINEKDLSSENKIDIFLKKSDSLVVFLANLDLGLKDDNADFLTGEAIFYAQKYFYHMNLFDVIDTQIARSLEKDYATMYPFDSAEDEPLLVKQKRNLERYKLHYGLAIHGYFELNAVLGGENAMLPDKSEANYRLYDRGRISVKVYDEDYVEIFETTKMQQEEGLIVSVAKAAQELAKTGKGKQARFFKIYLLTELEPIEKNEDTLLINYLDCDDGVLVEYKDNSALLVADDRPDNPEDLEVALKQKAMIPFDVPTEDISFYRFKTVEINYGD